MLFRLVLQDKGLSMIGFDYLEVLAIVPFRVTQHGKCEECGHAEDGGPFWIMQSTFFCRTEHGIQALSENDVMEEVANGVYCEEGGEAEAAKAREPLTRYRDSQVEAIDDQDEAEDN